jgi:hypothetical protein
VNQSIVQQRLDEVLLFVLDVRLFHGNRKVKPDDLADALDVAVSQDEVFTLGVKRVFDKEFVNKLNRVKSAMERVCGNVGTPFLAGFAIPEAKADGAADELEALVREGNRIKAEILANFDAICRDYALRHSKWKDVIERNGFTETYVRDRIHFGWRAIKVSAGRDSGLISDGLNAEVGGLLGSLLAGVAKAANRFIDESLTGREAVTRKALRPLVAARDKLSGFVFLDSRVQPLCTVIDLILASMPDEGRIEGIHLTNLIGMASILTKPVMALEVGDKAACEDPDKVFEQFFATQQPAQAEPQVAVDDAIATAAAPSPIVIGPQPTPQAARVPASLPAVMVPALAPAVVDFGNLFG